MSNDKKRKNETNEKKKKKKKKNTHFMMAVFEDVDTLFRIMESVKDLISDIPITFDENGIHFNAMDSAHVCMISLAVKGSELKHYHIEKPIKIGINSTVFSKILKSKKGYSLSLEKKTEDDAILSVRLTNKDDTNNEKLFNIKEVDIEMDSLDVPEISYEYIFDMTSDEFKKILSDSGSFADEIKFACIDNYLYVAVKGDEINAYNRPKAMRIMEALDSGEPKKSIGSLDDDVIENHFSENVGECPSFAMKYMINFSKASSISEWCKISFSSEFPAKIVFPFENGLGDVTYYLAPKIDNEGE